MLSFKKFTVIILLSVCINVLSDSWTVENVKINSLGDQLEIHLKSLQLPIVNEKIVDIDYTCKESEQIYPLHVCEKGNLSFNYQAARYELWVSGWINLQHLTWDLAIENKAKSILVKSNSKTEEQITIQLKQLSLTELENLSKPYLNGDVVIPEGKLSADLIVDFGKELTLDVDYLLENINWESSSGEYVLADTFHQGQMSIQQKENGLEVLIANNLAKGEGLFKDIYVLFDKTPVEIKAKIPINKNFEPGNILVYLSAKNTIDVNLVWTNWVENKLKINFKINDLNQLYKGFLKSFLAINGIENLSILGQSQGFIAYENDHIIETNLTFNELYLEIDSKKILVENLSGYINWKEFGDWQKSNFKWDSLLLAGMPVKQSDINLQSVGQKIQLEKNTSLAIFDGSIFIDNLLLQDIFSPQISIDFDGDVNPISIALITEKMGWPLMTGSISGKIPGMKKKGDRITFDGYLDLKIFDGNMQVSDFSIERLFGIAPVIAADISFQNLNLQQITSTFDFGKITGLVEGYVNDLRITNWKPDRLVAHLNSVKTKGIKQTISQRAIDNISSIGGIQGALSRSFLRFFDDFRYKKIGFGCKLRNAICEMSGIKSNKKSYQLVEGSGLPSINIIGYRQFVDWEVFLDRLLNAGY